ncbi:MAG: ABC transporter substrate-binding protein [Planctomycetes bacterium]|nr:ABC transporter substrate-binding protein [Planctomycetota bacterium]
MTAARIVSLVPSLTALLADLGLDDEVVGLTRFCTDPPGWKRRKCVVGGTKDVHRERIAELEPDLILANREENVREQVEALEAIAPVHLTEIKTVADDLAAIRAIGALVGREQAAESLALRTEAAFAALPSYPPLRTLYLIWSEPYMCAGGDTFIHAVLSAGGFDNVCGERLRYPSLEPEVLQALEPEVILLSSEPYPFREKHTAELAALVPTARIALVDGVPFSWYGSRAADAPAYLESLRARL